MKGVIPRVFLPGKNNEWVQQQQQHGTQPARAAGGSLNTSELERPERSEGESQVFPVVR